MKELHEWDEDYLLSIIPPDEQDWIELKGRGAFDLTIPTVNESKVRSDLSKALSALGNSGGGYLALGINDKTHGVDDGGISRFIRKSGTREWLEDIIPYLVDLPLPKFNVAEIVATSASSKIISERAVYVIQVYESALAPHQAKDNIYYFRQGGKSKPINHRMLLDILGRRKNPEITVELEFMNMDVEVEGDIQDCFSLVISVKNEGFLLANYVNCLIEVPMDFFGEQYESSQDWSFGQSHYLTKECSYYVPMLYRNVDANGNFNPILPGLKHTWKFSIGNDFIRKQPITDKRSLYWKIYADNASPKEGMTSIAEIPIIDATVPRKLTTPFS